MAAVYLFGAEPGTERMHATCLGQHSMSNQIQVTDTTIRGLLSNQSGDCMSTDDTQMDDRETDDKRDYDRQIKSK